MPLAYRRVAALYVFFFKQIDAAPPRVSLRDLLSVTIEVALAAAAIDDVSAFDKLGYVFEYRDLDALGVWQSVVAAGNRGMSAPRQWRAGDAAAAR